MEFVGRSTLVEWRRRIDRQMMDIAMRRNDHHLQFNLRAPKLKIAAAVPKFAIKTAGSLLYASFPQTILFVEISSLVCKDSPKHLAQKLMLS